jgi:hypothetical protein
VFTRETIRGDADEDMVALSEFACVSVLRTQWAARPKKGMCWGDGSNCLVWCELSVEEEGSVVNETDQ